MLSVHSCHLLFDHFQFTLIHGPNIPGSYAILFFTASDFTTITSQTHNWALLLLWLCLFILSGVTSPLIGGFKQNIVHTREPTETELDLPLSVLSPEEVWVSSGLLTRGSRGSGYSRPGYGISPLGGGHHYPHHRATRTSTGLGKQTLGGHKQNLVHTRT